MPPLKIQKEKAGESIAMNSEELVLAIFAQFIAGILVLMVNLIVGRFQKKRKHANLLYI